MSLLVPHAPCKICWKRSAEFEVGFGKHYTDTCVSKACIRNAVYGALTFSGGKAVFVRAIYGPQVCADLDAETSE